MDSATTALEDAFHYGEEEGGGFAGSGYGAGVGERCVGGREVGEIGRFERKTRMEFELANKDNTIYPQNTHESIVQVDVLTVRCIESYPTPTFTTIETHIRRISSIHHPLAFSHG